MISHYAILFEILRADFKVKEADGLYISAEYLIIMNKMNIIYGTGCYFERCKP